MLGINTSHITKLMNIADIGKEREGNKVQGHSREDHSYYHVRYQPINLIQNSKQEI